jgi:hypothetical protein
MQAAFGHLVSTTGFGTSRRSALAVFSTAQNALGSISFHNCPSSSPVALLSRCSLHARPRIADHHQQNLVLTDFGGVKFSIFA